MTYAASVGCYGRGARIKCFDGIGAGGKKGSNSGPDIVIIDVGAIGIDVEGRCYGVAS